MPLGFLLLGLGSALLLVIAISIAGPPRAFARLIWTLTGLSFVTALGMLILRYEVPPYLDTRYQLHNKCVVFLLLLTTLCMPILFAWRRPAAWRSRHERGGMLVLFGIALVIWEITPTYPTEEALRARFTLRRAAFEQFANMLREDQRNEKKHLTLHRWTIEEMATNGLNTPARLAMYRSLIPQIGENQMVFINAEEQSIDITFQMSGHPGAMAGYKYEFGAERPSPLVSSLDTPGPKGGMRYKQLEGPWYLFDYHGM